MSDYILVDDKFKKQFFHGFNQEGHATWSANKDDAMRFASHRDAMKTSAMLFGAMPIELKDSPNKPEPPPEPNTIDDDKAHSFLMAQKTEQAIRDDERAKIADKVGACTFPKSAHYTFASDIAEWIRRGCPEE